MLIVALLTLLGAAPTATCEENAAEVVRIQIHLSTIEHQLRVTDIGLLPPEVAARRASLLDRLHDYWMAGRFPHNHDYPGQRVPIFIDSHGTACAVAQLIIESGNAQMANSIAATRNTVRVGELSQETPFQAWAVHWGFTASELALIQPTYNWSRQRSDEELRKYEEEQRLKRERFERDCAAQPALFEWSQGSLQPRGTRTDFIEQIFSASETWGLGPRGLYRLVNERWELVFEGVGFRKLWASDRNVFVASNAQSPVIGEKTEQGWEFTSIPVPLAPHESSGAWQVTGFGNDAWFFGYTHVYRWSNHRFEVIPAPPEQRIDSLALTGPNEAWAIAVTADYKNRLVVWRGKTWQTVPRPAGLTPLLMSGRWLIEQRRNEDDIVTTWLTSKPRAWVTSEFPFRPYGLTLWGPNSQEAVAVAVRLRDSSSRQPVVLSWNGNQWKQAENTPGVTAAGSGDRPFLVPDWGSCPRPAPPPPKVPLELLSATWVGMSGQSPYTLNLRLIPTQPGGSCPCTAAGAIRWDRGNWPASPVAGEARLEVYNGIQINVRVKDRDGDTKSFILTTCKLFGSDERKSGPAVQMTGMRDSPECKSKSQ